MTLSKARSFSEPLLLPGRLRIQRKWSWNAWHYPQYFRGCQLGPLSHAVWGWPETSLVRLERQISLAPTQRALVRTDCQDPLAGEPCPQWSSILPSPALCPGYCLGCLPAPPRGTCRLFLQLFTELSLRKCQLDPFFFLVLQTCAGKSAGSADGFRFSFSSVKRPPLFKCNDNKNNSSDSYNGWHAHSGQTLAIYYFMILTRTL